MRAILAELDACFGPERGDVDFDAYSEANTRFHAPSRRCPAAA